MNVFKMSVAALAAVVGSMVTEDCFGAGPVYSAGPNGAATTSAPSTVAYRKVCTPTGCYLVPVTPPQTTPKVTYRKVCTPTGCYLVPITSAPATTAPVKNYSTLFPPKTSPTGSSVNSRPNASPMESPFYTDGPSMPPGGNTPLGSSPSSSQGVAKPISSSPGRALPSPFYP